MSRMRWFSGPVAAFVLTPFLASCQQPEATTTEVTNCTEVLGAQVCTWATLADGAVTELGWDVPLSLIEGVPADAPMTWPPMHLTKLAFPEEVRTATGADHVSIYWEAHGHPPGPFLTPHFDFHVYSVSEDAVGAMDCTDETKPAMLPAGYATPDLTIPELGTLVGLCVPLMGMHALPQADLEQEGLFEATMIVGYYGGSPIFYEPMIAQEYLLQRAGFGLEVPSVDGLPEGVTYPSAFRAEYDEATDSYRMVFSGFGAGA